MIQKSLRQSVLTYLRRGIQYASGLFPKLKIPLTSSVVQTLGSTTYSFSRSTAATVIDYEGVIHTTLINEIRFQGARRVHNLFRYSSDFSNSSWVKQSVTITTNAAVAPDGKSTAYKMVSILGASTGIYQIPTSYVKGVDHILSIYAKAAGKDSITVAWNGYGTTVFNLSTGTLAAGNGGIEDVGDGWYRCYSKISCTTTGQAVTIRFSDTTGDGVSGVYLWNAQLEEVKGTQTLPSEIVPTNVLSPPYYGAWVDGVEYFTTDRDGNSISQSICRGYLNEPQSTNELKYSEDFSTWSNSWSGGGTKLTAGAGTIGGISAYSIAQINATSNGVFRTESLVASTAYTWSLYVKNISAVRSRVDVVDAVNGVTNSLFITWTDGVPSTYSADSDFSSIQYTEIADDEWRISFTYSTVASSTTYHTIIRPEVAVTATNAILATGVQVEKSIMTSYIPTSGTSVTRTADVLSYDVEDVITQGQGSLYCEFYLTLYAGQKLFSLFKDSQNRIFCYVSSSSTMVLAVKTSNVDVAVISISSITSGLNKLLITYEDNSLKCYLNGELKGSDTSCSMPVDVTTLSVGAGYDNTNQVNGTVKNVMYFKEVLPQSEAIRRTS